MAPPEQREQYISMTVVVAPVGDGPGEIGFLESPLVDVRPEEARHFTVDVYGNIYILDVVNQRVVRFDPEGRFVANIPYGDAVKGPEGLAVDAEGWVYVYEQAAYGPTQEEAVPKVKLFDSEGRLLRAYPIPRWIDYVYTIRIDQKGTLWVLGDGFNPDAPVIEGHRYLRMAVALGTADERFDEQQQKASVTPGHVFATGESVLIYSPSSNSPGFLYDQQGRRTHQLPFLEGLHGIDQWGNFYTLDYREEGTGIMRLRKYNAQGWELTAFVLTKSAYVEYPNVIIDGKGTVYCFLWNWTSKDAYRVIRWQRE
jgi:hypothetical protein